MKKELEAIRQKFHTALTAVTTTADLEELETAYLGRKNGILTKTIKQLATLPKEKIAPLGQLANEIKQEIASQLSARKTALTSARQPIDITLPGTPQPHGHYHLMTKAIDEISAIFERLGYEIVHYGEVEWDYYAFEALNMPANHPARDEWETFFIDRQPINKKYGQRILTPHTSSGQVRHLENRSLPVKMINISKCYRRQIDVSHTPMFHQFEGLLVDQNITISHLKGTLDFFVKSFFGPERQTRLRPYHFQFTEPSFEIDINCGICLGTGCKMCKEGWLELGGAGMVHPNVLRAGGVDATVYSGFAFGWGVERTYLMKSNINISDIRLLYKNDIRFLEQF